MKFFVDQTLGRLTKWLRLLGFDVVQIRLTPEELRNLPTPKRDTFILTRQTSLPKKSRRPDLVILESDQPEAQLMEICRRLHLPPETWEPLNRCSICNKILLPITPEQAEGRVPDYISQKHEQFFECPQCGRVFWEGSHQRSIRRRLQALHNHIIAR
jgi:uncharacterized protein with PIN domain